MANYIVDGTELTSVANAIRTKGGTNLPLVFPNGFVSAVNNISGGGGSSDFSTAEVTINSPESFELTWDSCPMLLDGALQGSLYVESLPATITVPLYNGKCRWDKTTQGLTLSGNIEELYDGEAMLITGDCTIAIVIS